MYMYSSCVNVSMHDSIIVVHGRGVLLEITNTSWTDSVYYVFFLVSSHLQYSSLLQHKNWKEYAVVYYNASLSEIWIDKILKFLLL